MKFFKSIVVTILTLESRIIIRKYKPYVVAVTGSVGKTSTKDAIYDVLKDQSKFVRKSEKSLNSEIGLPLTIIGVPNAWHSLSGWMRNIAAGFRLIIRKSPYPDCLILEIGADHPGDIKKVTKWLHPDITVITKVSRKPVHVEFFKSPEEVFEEKAALAMAVKPGGTLVLFADDEKVAGLAERVKNKNVKILTYGLNPEAVVKGVFGKVLYESGPVGFVFDVNIDGNVFPITVRNIIGDVYMYPILAAASVGKVCSISIEKLSRLLAAYEAPKGRMNLIPGLYGSTIIDDTYNSSPDAALSALETLKHLETTGVNGTFGTKIAVLGDMMELGKFSSDEHRKIGREVAGAVGQLITVGQRSRATAEEAVTAGLPISKVHSFDTSLEAAGYVGSIVKSGDIILVKGSQSIRMERVVKSLMRESEKSSSLLVRQESEWLEKK